MSDVRRGAFGSDSGHDFEVIEERDSEVRIEYQSDGRRAWFIRSRFQYDENGELQLI